MVVLSLLSLLYIGLNIHCCSYSQLAVFQIYYINCISPGFIKTAMTDKIEDKFKELILSKIPSGRLGEPQDVANAVIFLASNQSNYINGETLHINGGMYMA